MLLGRDMRESGVGFAAAFAEGVQSQGLDVVDLGLASTDLVYFASGTLGAPAAMFTASHNPAQYNGIKFCLSNAKAVGQDTGLDRIKALTRDGVPPANREPGSLSSRDLLQAFATHVRSFLDPARPGTEVSARRSSCLRARRSRAPGWSVRCCCRIRSPC